MCLHTDRRTCTSYTCGTVGAHQCSAGIRPVPTSCPLSSFPSSHQRGRGTAMALLLCNARECPGGGEVQGQGTTIQIYAMADLDGG